MECAVAVFQGHLTALC